MEHREAFLLGDTIKGSYVELGFGKGISARLYADMINKGELKNRPFWVFDSFKGIPTPSQIDLTYNPSLKEGMFSRPVQPALDLRFDIPQVDYKVIRGYLHDTHSSFTDEFINVLNIDLDSYSSTLLALEAFHPKVPLYGVVIVPSYSSNNGVKAAVDEYYETNGITHQIKTTNIFVNTNAPSYLTKRNVFKNNDIIEKRVPVNVEDEPMPFRSKVKEKDPIKYDTKIDSPLVNNISRDVALTEKRIPTQQETAVEPFPDRYTKKQPDNVSYVKSILNNARVLFNKVTR